MDHLYEILHAFHHTCLNIYIKQFVEIISIYKPIHPAGGVIVVFLAE